MLQLKHVNAQDMELPYRNLDCTSQYQTCSYRARSDSDIISKKMEAINVRERLETDKVFLGRPHTLNPH